MTQKCHSTTRRSLGRWQPATNDAAFQAKRLDKSNTHSSSSNSNNNSSTDNVPAAARMPWWNWSFQFFAVSTKKRKRKRKEEKVLKSVDFINSKSSFFLCVCVCLYELVATLNAHFFLFFLLFGRLLKQLKKIKKRSQDPFFFIGFWAATERARCTAAAPARQEDWFFKKTGCFHLFIITWW